MVYEVNRIEMCRKNALIADSTPRRNGISSFWLKEPIDQFGSTNNYPTPNGGFQNRKRGFTVQFSVNLTICTHTHTLISSHILMLEHVYRRRKITVFRKVRKRKRDRKKFPVEDDLAFLIF